MKQRRESQISSCWIWFGQKFPFYFIVVSWLDRCITVWKWPMKIHRVWFASHHKFIANVCRNCARIMRLMQRYIPLNPQQTYNFFSCNHHICAYIESDTYSCEHLYNGMCITVEDMFCNKFFRFCWCHIPKLFADVSSNSFPKWWIQIKYFKNGKFATILDLFFVFVYKAIFKFIQNRLHFHELLFNAKFFWSRILIVANSASPVTHTFYSFWHWSFKLWFRFVYGFDVFRIKTLLICRCTSKNND